MPGQARRRAGTEPTRRRPHPSWAAVAAAMLDVWARVRRTRRSSWTGVLPASATRRVVAAAVPTALVALAMLVIAPALVVVPPAAAHPSGPPPVAELTATGHELVIEWSAADDDYAALAVAAGALPPDAAIDRTDLQDGPVRLPPAQQEAARTSPDLADYVAERVSVEQDGRVCELSEVATAALFTTGLTTRAVCPDPVTSVDVEIGLLTDLDAAYRTVALATGPAMPQKTMYTVDRATLHWDFGASGDDTIAWWMLVPVAVISAVAVVACAWLARRWEARRWEERT